MPRNVTRSDSSVCLFGASKEQPPAHLCQIAIDYSPQHGIAFHHCITEIAKLHQDNVNAVKFSYYGNPIGSGTIRIFYSSETNCLEDKYLHLVSLTNDETHTNKIISDFKKAIVKQEESLLTLTHYEENNVKRKLDTSFPFIYSAIIRLHSDKNNTDQIPINDLITLYTKYYKKFNWALYRVSPSVYHLFVPLISYKEIEAIEREQEVVSNDQTLMAIREKAHSKIANYQTYLLSYVENCSNNFQVSGESHV